MKQKYKSDESRRYAAQHPWFWLNDVGPIIMMSTPVCGCRLSRNVCTLWPIWWWTKAEVRRGTLMLPRIERSLLLLLMLPRRTSSLVRKGRCYPWTRVVSVVRGVLLTRLLLMRGGTRGLPCWLLVNNVRSAGARDSRVDTSYLLLQACHKGLLLLAWYEKRSGQERTSVLGDVNLKIPRQLSLKQT